LRYWYGLGQAEIALEAAVSYCDMLARQREAVFQHAAGGEQIPTSGLQTNTKWVGF
jgi:hypothetical protein